jgi:6-phosphogluconolactonase
MMLRFFVCLALLVALLAAPAAAGQKAQSDKLRVYVGTYTTGKSKSKGIYLLELDLKKGALSAPVLAGEAVNPSFLALHPGGRFLYAVGEVADFGKDTGAVSAFAIDKAGKLTLLNQQPSKGAGPCHLVVDKEGKNALVANYGGGSAAVLPIGADGKLAPATSWAQHSGHSVNKQRQEGPHCHSINLDKANRFAAVADLGLDRISVYRFDPAKSELGRTEPGGVNVAPGSGPRHFAFHPDGKHAYVINELVCTVTAFDYNAGKGTLKEIETKTTLPHKMKPGYSTAEVQVHPSGKFLYGSNRGHDSIAVFAIDPATGKLTSVQHEPTQGKTPRNFGIDPTGTYLLAANQDSDNIVVFRIDPKTGRLTAAGQMVEVPMPVCVKFLAAPAGE